MMSDTTDRRPLWRRKRWLALLLLLLVTWLGWRTFAANRNYDRVVKLQSTIEDPTASAEQRQQAFREMRTAFAALTPAQRDRLDADRQKKQEAEYDRYFAMTKAEQKKYLDERINAVQKRMSQGIGTTKGGTMPTSFSFGGNSSSRPPSSGKTKSPDEIEAMKKKMLDRSSPDLRAKRDRFRNDLEKRAKERGIAIPSGGPGGRR